MEEKNKDREIKVERWRALEERDGDKTKRGERRNEERGRSERGRKGYGRKRET